jgi:hypothetical protein
VETDDIVARDRAMPVRATEATARTHENLHMFT